MVGETGVGVLHVPSSKIVGSYDLLVEWKNLTVSRSALFIADDTSLNVGVEVYDVGVRVRILSFDIPNALVELSADSETVSSGLTNATGIVNFTQIPPGKYGLEISYFGTRYQTSLNVTREAVTIVAVPVPYQDLLPYLAILVGALVVAAVVVRRRKTYRWPFEYMNLLTNASIPDSHTTVIAGNTGSGKSVVLESLAFQSLSTGRGCVYVTNVELPSDVRATMKSIGLDVSEFEDRGRLVFIDCYSSLSGSASKERRSTSSVTDLTALGVQITQAMEEIGGTADVCFDALTPLFSVLKTEYVLNFLQSIGARVKSSDGGLSTTIGTTVEKDAVTKVEEVADCVIETHLSEGRGGQRRRLRVKKLRGHPYVDSWARFTIGDQGITFLVHRPPKS
jgi:KaiC/GvpD/RAD55 family RecA-like ATPase